MKKDEIQSLAHNLLETVPGNVLTEDMDIDPRFAGLRLFDAPLVGFGSASDPLFEEYKKPGIIGPWHMSPKEWLPGAESVISIFLPFTEEVRSSNRDETAHASTPWLYARIEGQAFIGKYIEALAACLEKQGIAGRFCSLIADLPLEPDIRPYREIYEYCIHCNACVRRCPVGAIDPVTGKDHPTCHAFVENSKKVFKPRYGCGLCQTGVPCEAENPLHLMD